MRALATKRETNAAAKAMRDECPSEPHVLVDAQLSLLSCARTLLFASFLCGRCQRCRTGLEPATIHSRVRHEWLMCACR